MEEKKKTELKLQAESDQTNVQRLAPLFSSIRQELGPLLACRNTSQLCRSALSLAELLQQ